MEGSIDMEPKGCESIGCLTHIVSLNFDLNNDLPSSVKFQGHTALKIVEFHPNWLFLDCDSSLKSPMARK